MSGFGLFCFDSSAGGPDGKKESSCFAPMMCEDGSSEVADNSKRLKLKHGAIMKILVVGDTGVGKSAVANSFVNIQNKRPPSTPRKSDASKAQVPKVDFLHANVERQGYKLHVIFHDFAGADAHPDEFPAELEPYVTAAVGAIVVTDATAFKSSSLKKWKDLIDRLNPVPTVLVTNKCDLVDQEFLNEHNFDEQMDAFCREQGILKWSATSAATSEGVNKIFYYLLDRVVDMYS